MAEASMTKTVRQKHSSLSFGDSFSPVILSSNLANMQVFLQRWNELSREMKSRFDQLDYVSNLDDVQGRFTNIRMEDVIPDELRWAPAHPSLGPLHVACGECAAKIWFWTAAQHLVPRVFQPSSLFADSDDESDVEDYAAVAIGELDSKAKITEWLRKPVMSKVSKRMRKNASNALREKKDDDGVWVKIDSSEQDHLARKRAAADKEDKDTVGKRLKRNFTG